MNALLQFFILSNAILVTAFIVMRLFELPLKSAGYGHAYKFRLNLATAAILATGFALVLSPFSGWISNAMGINATDVVVAQFLKGNLAMSAIQLSGAFETKSAVLNGIMDTATTSAQIILALFIFAAVLRTGYLALNVVRIVSIVSSSRTMKSSRGLVIAASDKISIPFSTRDWRRYYIVVPEHMLTDRRSFRVAMGHEAQHIRQRDVDWEIALSLLSPVLVLNPVFWLLSDRIRRFREYACDAAFLARSKVDPKQYSLALLKIAADAGRKSNGYRTQAVSVPLFGRDSVFSRAPKSSLGRRVLAISTAGDASGKPGKLAGLVCAIALAGATIVAVSAFAKPSEWSHDRLMLSTVVNLERLDRINTLSAPPIWN